MLVKSMFVKDLGRAINGVVMAEQQDDAIVWQELDEYVVTRELDKHFRKFFTSYLTALDNPKDPSVSGGVGVWISGFFGSGKSHFLKILSYLLRSRLAQNPKNGETRKAPEFFDSKVQDPLLLADIKRAVGTSADVILFNIDSRADSKDGRDAILRVFQRVFNEMQGFSGDHPYIAEMERYLSERNALEKFHLAFREASGVEWLDERDSVKLLRDEVVQGLASALDMTRESAAHWFDTAEQSFSLSIDGFAKRVKEYLDLQGPRHQLMFLVDEVGQFIGGNTQLMLTLQTITEDLGRICGGRAWVIVTSQEDIDAVLGDLRAAKAHDFSKIQGRFRTRLSLSSSNTDEVIQARLLEKTDEANRALGALFDAKGDILKNQLSFVDNRMTLRNYRDTSDFAAHYPFAPFHFQLVQKIFESVRKAGATGLHLSRGERSMLDAFQSAARRIAHRPLGALVPLYQFYPAIESFLDTMVKRTIDQAEDNPNLERPFDVEVLRTLFLIRYVDEFKPNIDNLVTLLIDEADADRLELRKRLEESLHRLEQETLINRNGDLFYFLTNEERDVSREIKSVDTSSSEETRLLGELVYEEVLKGYAKFRYKVNRNDYGFNRLVDGQTHGSRLEQQLSVAILSPLADDYELYIPGKCILASAEEGGRVLIKLPNESVMGKELQTWLKTDKYIKQKTDAAASETLKRILADRANENRERRGRLITQLEKLLVNAEYYAIGQGLNLTGTSPRMLLDEALNYLTENIFTKLGYIKNVLEEPLKALVAVLKADDIGQQQLRLKSAEGNPDAAREIRQYIDLLTSKNNRVMLDELVAHFQERPFGWPEWEIVLLVARMFMAGELHLMEGANLQPSEAVDSLSKAARWKQVKILKRKTVGELELKSSRKQGQTLFGEIGPDAEDELYAFLQERLGAWKAILTSRQPLAELGTYPGRADIERGLTLLKKLSGIRDSYEFFQVFRQKQEDLEGLTDDIHDIDSFYRTQKTTWEKLRKAAESFKPNQSMLARDPAANVALTRIQEILSAPRPYGMLHQADTLIDIVSKVNDQVIATKRQEAVTVVEQQLEQAKKMLSHQKIDPVHRNAALKPLQDLKKQAEVEKSIPNLSLQLEQAREALETVQVVIDEVIDPEQLKIVRPIKTITLSGLMSGSYLEDAADAADFLAKLKAEIDTALSRGSRVRIR